jgi:hypothetical protein
MRLLFLCAWKGVSMKYYGFTKEQLDKMISALNTIGVTSMAQNDAFHEATTILRHPIIINTPEEGEKKDGEEIHSN